MKTLIKVLVAVAVLTFTGNVLEYMFPRFASDIQWGIAFAVGMLWGRVVFPLERTVRENADD